MQAAEANLYLGQTISGRYRVDAFVGDGAFSGTFRARDLTEKEDVAIKILSLASSQDPDAVFEFQEETRLLGLLETCSHVVRLLDSGRHTMPIQVQGGATAVQMDVSFMVLELASASLADVLAQRQQIPWLDRLRLFRDVVKGAHQMHVQRILHRDIKSDNVLLFETRPPLAKLSDLGRSKDTRQSPRVVPNQYEAGRGDPSFLPPEMLWLQGASDAHSYLRADLYLLGSVLFELASGVGLTAFALGNPRVIIAQALRLDPAARDQEFQNRIPDLRSQMELAYDAFRQELPNSIKHEATMLLRQLTNPDPVLRQPVRPFQNLPPVWDLQWLLRRIDILVLRLETALRDTTTVRRRRSRT